MTGPGVGGATDGGGTRPAAQSGVDVAASAVAFFCAATSSSSGN